MAPRARGEFNERRTGLSNRYGGAETMATADDLIIFIDDALIGTGLESGLNIVVSRLSIAFSRYYNSSVSTSTSAGRTTTRLTGRNIAVAAASRTNRAFMKSRSKTPVSMMSVATITAIPFGEINMTQPVDFTGQFCRTGAGWRVFALASAISRSLPTVSPSFSSCRLKVRSNRGRISTR